MTETIATESNLREISLYSEYPIELVALLWHMETNKMLHVRDSALIMDAYRKWTEGKPVVVLGIESNKVKFWRIEAL